MNVWFIQACDLLNLIENGTSDNPDGTLGLFFWNLPDTTGGCIEITEKYWDQSSIDDWALKGSRICALLALLFGAIMVIFGFFKQCLFPLPCSQCLLDISSTCIQLSLALVYLIWFSPTYCRESQYECTYGDGSLYLILCQVLWIIAGCLTRCMRPGRSERSRRRRDDD